MTKYLLAGLLLISAVPPAAAATGSGSGSWTDGKFSAAGLIGYGVGFDSTNEYGFGFGARGGYAFPFQLYTGVSFNYYIGTSPRGFPNVTLRVWTLAAEAGYEIPLGPVEIRPFLGIGLATATASVGAFGTGSTTYFSLMPGVVATYSFNGPLSTGPFVGADVHLTWIPAGLPGNIGGGNDISFLATGGYRF